jgi:hypothetical protein
MKGKLTRRTFLGATTAGVAGTLVEASPASAAPRIRLDLEYVRTEVPAVRVRYPGGWHFYPRLVTDMIVPVELFSISSQPLEPGPSLDESGLPDVSKLGVGGALISVHAQRLGPDGRYSHDPRLGPSLSLERLTRGGSRFPGTEFRTGWFVGDEWGYLVRIWTGGTTAELGTVNAILQTVRPL